MARADVTIAPPTAGFQVIDGFGCSTKPFDNSDLFGTDTVAMTQGQQDAVLDAVFTDLKLTRERPLVKGTSAAYQVEPSNDNADPYVYNAAGFQFSRIDANTALLTGARTRGLRMVWFSPVTRESWMPAGSTGWSATEIAEYAEWLLAMARRLKANGQPADYISVANEPSYTRNTIGGAVIRDIIKELGPRLASEGLTTRFVVPDDVRSTDGAAKIDTIMADATARSYVAAFATHGYDEALSNVAQIQTRAATWGVPWWFTESGMLLLSSQGLPQTAMQYALFMHDCLATYNCSAIDYEWGWFGEEDTDQLVRLDHTGTTYDGMVKLKVFYAFGQFSRDIDPGSLRVAATSSDSNVKVSAYRKNGKRTVVAINNTAGALTPTLTVASINGLSTMSAYRTSGNTTGSGDDWLALSAQSVTGSTIAPTLPATSITTFTGSF